MRNLTLLLYASMLAGYCTMAPAEGLLNENDQRFLEGVTAAVVEASRVPPRAKVGAIGPNVTGGTVIRPGGRNCYPAFWIRDYAMSLDSGLVTPDEQRHMLLLTARHQQDEQWALPSGSVVPPGAIADHITFGDKPIFYPGTLEDYDGQGGPRWGKLPCLDDHFFFVHMAAVYVRATGDAAVLDHAIRGKTLIERLEGAFRVPPARPDTGLVYCDAEERGITFGFVDTVMHTGELLFCSLLKYQAALEMAGLRDRLGHAADAQRHRDLAARLQRAIQETFAFESGMLRASTGKSAQPDVWGTAYAVYVGALDDAHARRACEALAQGCRGGTITWRGNIRHVPTDGDFSDATAWEVALAKKNTYQNGAYWGTATGWVAYAVAQTDRALARQLALEYIAELREGDFRKGPEFGSPWECMHPDGNHRQNPVYMTSVTCPMAAFKRADGASE